MLTRSDLQLFAMTSIATSGSVMFEASGLGLLRVTSGEYLIAWSVPEM